MSGEGGRLGGRRSAREEVVVVVVVRLKGRGAGVKTGATLALCHQQCGGHEWGDDRWVDAMRCSLTDRESKYNLRSQQGRSALALGRPNRTSRAIGASTLHASPRHRVDPCTVPLSPITYKPWFQAYAGQDSKNDRRWPVAAAASAGPLARAQLGRLGVWVERTDSSIPHRHRSPFRRLGHGASYAFRYSSCGDWRGRRAVACEDVIKPRRCER